MEKHKVIEEVAKDVKEGDAEAEGTVPARRKRGRPRKVVPVDVKEEPVSGETAQKVTSGQEKTTNGSENKNKRQHRQEEPKLTSSGGTPSAAGSASMARSRSAPCSSRREGSRRKSEPKRSAQQ
ncbi:hypothetical protein KP509_1Z035700 [Ceratopteris richardii]|nr:hypothetical protein KP509_1Z035700 [Ceratopteris richardii]